MLASQDELVVYALHSALNNLRIQPSLLPVFAETSLAAKSKKRWQVTDKAIYSRNSRVGHPTQVRHVGPK